MNEITFVDGVRLMFDKTKIGNTTYSAFLKHSSHALVFIIDTSIMINNVSIDLLINIPTRVKNVHVPISIVRIILSPVTVIKNVVKMLKTSHTITW